MDGSIRQEISEFIRIREWYLENSKADKKWPFNNVSEQIEKFESMAKKPVSEVKQLNLKFNQNGL